MAQPKLSKKELRGDELLNAFERIIRYISLHSKPFAFVAVGFVFLIITISAAYIYFEKYEAKASRALFAANQVYRENLALISEDSPLERGGIPDFEKPLKLYQEISTLFPRSESASEALYQSAQCFYHLAKYDEAISAFQQYIQRYPRGSFSLLAGLGLGYCYEQKSEFDKAAAAYSATIDKNPRDALIGEALVSLGRCQEATGKPAEASKTYTQVVERFPNSTWKFYAERKLLYLKSH